MRTQEWRFDSFLTILLQMALIYMGAALVLPDVADGAGIDLEQHYQAQRRPFFACLLATVVVSLFKDWMLSGSLPDWLNVAFHGAMAAVAVFGMLVRGRTLQTSLAVTVAILFAAYIASLFARL